ncbi:MAG: hypothetical protein KatS3mg109_1380 [Pirellulaceae bacterium]|nr:MAG: hypothetical protein KatS3mg109_1380 [Pirellulaceae bacterium]GIW93704.1 MAG: hypothetical protein KatS3mg110_1745 [Pirellulaceae bacterium]
MLVLSRKQGESLIINGDIRVTVTRISGNRVSIGIEAPSDVRIVRAELNRADRRDTQPALPGMDEPHLLACCGQ